MGSFLLRFISVLFLKFVRVMRQVESYYSLVVLVDAVPGIYLGDDEQTPSYSDRDHDDLETQLNAEIDVCY